MATFNVFSRDKDAQKYLEAQKEKFTPYVLQYKEQIKEKSKSEKVSALSKSFLRFDFLLIAHFVYLHILRALQTTTYPFPPQGEALTSLQCEAEALDELLADASRTRKNHPGPLR